MAWHQRNVVDIDMDSMYRYIKKFLGRINLFRLFVYSQDSLRRETITLFGQTFQLALRNFVIV
jgi:hypothetical protein